MSELDKQTQDEIVLMKYEMAEVNPELADVEIETPIQVYMYALASVALTGAPVTIQVEHEGRPEKLKIENLGKTSDEKGTAISVSSESGNQELSELWGSIAEKLMNSMFAEDEEPSSDE